MYPKAFLDTRPAIPPRVEPRAIMSQLSTARARTTDLEATLHRSISLLKERCAALITAAVTGQIAPEAMEARRPVSAG